MYKENMQAQQQMQHVGGYQQAINDRRGGILGSNSSAPTVREREIHDELSGVDLQLENLRANLTEFIQRLNPVLRPEDSNKANGDHPVVATPVGRRIQAQRMALVDVNSALRTALDRLEV